MFKGALPGLATGGVSSLMDFGLQALGNAVLPMSKAQRQQNEFNSAEAARARDFSAQQAELSRDWQEDMYAQYNSLQGKINQAKEAGVNPMFAVTGSATSPMSPQSPNVSAPAASGSSASPIGQISDITSAALGFSKLSSEIDNIKSQTRHMNAQALKTELEALWVDKLNAQSIAESVSRINLADVTMDEKRANISLLAAKVLESEATTEEKYAHIGKIAAEVNNLNADTDNKVATLQQIIASIDNTNMDTKLKKAMFSKVLAETRNEKLMAGLITQNTHLSRAQRKEFEARTKVINQQYDHNEIMNAFDEYARGLQMATEEFYNPQTQVGQAAKWLCEAIVEVLSLGGYVSFNTTDHTSTSTVTTIDGNVKPKHGRIGF